MSIVARILPLLAAVLMAGAGQAAESLSIQGAWARATPPVATVGAAYFSVVNTTPAADRLVRVSTPVAERVEIHETRMEGGTARMRPLQTLAAPSGTTELRPGGIHLMLLNLKGPLTAGSRFPLTLEFERAGKMSVEVDVMTDAPAAHHHGHH